MQWRALCACMYTLLHIHTCSLQYFTSSLTQWNVSVSDLQLLLYGGVASSKFIQLLPHVAHSINKIGFQVRTHLTKVLIDLCENINYPHSQVHMCIQEHRIQFKTKLAICC